MPLKYCRKCNTEKPITAFRRHTKRKDGLQTQCQACFSIYYKSWYQANKLAHRKATKQRSKRQKDINYEWIERYLSEHPCVDCRESDSRVLEFDHVRGTKAYHMSRLVAGGGSLETIQKEIAKCVVRCANCHRRKTAKRWTVRNKFRYCPASI